MEDRQLLVFSIAFSLWAIASIVVPYVRRQTDLLTARNFFLVGSLLYVGFSGIKASREGHYHQYSSQVFLLYYAYIVTFFVVCNLAYKKLKWPRHSAEKRFMKWPMQEGIGLWFPLMLCFVAIAGQIALVQVPGLRVLVNRVGLIAPVFALAFGLTIWKSNKLNPVAIGVVVLVFLAGAYLAFSVGGGRRPLYALAVTIPCCLYWWYLRYRRPIFTLGLFAGLLVLGPIADSAYRAARWYGHFGAAAKQDDVGAGARWEIFKQSLFSGSESFEDSALQIGQTTVENMLLTIYIFNEGGAEFPGFYVKPLHSLYVILTLPIPRILWEDKPQPLGVTLPYDSRVLTKQIARTNWGPGIAAHAIHDGGILAAVLYAVLIGAGLRFIDEVLVRHPGNPYLLGFLSSASVQIAGYIRGDLATMIPLSLLCLGFMIALAWATKMVVGAENPWPQIHPSTLGAKRAFQ